MRNSLELVPLAVAAVEFPYLAPHSMMQPRDFHKTTTLRSARNVRAARAASGWLAGGLRIVGAALLIVCSLAGSAHAADDVLIATLIPFAEKAEIRDSIRQECGLGSKLSKAVVRRGAKKEVVLSRVGNLAEQAAPGRSLELRITDAIQTGAGLFPAHSITIDGVLKEGGRIVGTMEGTRVAQASFIPFRRGECAILGEAIRLLAKDVIRWVKQPRLDARLGEAR